MEYKGFERGEIPEFALRPAQPEPMKPESMSDFDAAAYDRLFEEMTQLKQSFAEEVRQGNAAIEAQEKAIEAERAELQSRSLAVSELPMEHGEEGSEAAAFIQKMEMANSGNADSEFENPAELSSGIDVETAKTEERIDDAETAESLKPMTDNAIPTESTSFFREESAFTEKNALETAELSKEETAEAEAVRIYPAGNEILTAERKFVDLHCLPPVRIHIEEDLLVPDTKPDLASVLMMDGTCRLSETEFQTGSAGRKELRVNGELCLKLLYLPVDSSVKCVPLSSAVPFREDLAADMEPESRVCVSASVEALDFEIINERKYRVKADLCVMLRVYRNRSMNLFCGVKGENMQLHKELMSVTEVALRRKETLEISEFLKPKEERGEVSEILMWKADPTETHRQISEGKAVVSGVIACQILYRVQGEGEENETPELYHGEIEFTQFIKLPDDADRKPLAGSRASFLLKNMSIEVADDENGMRNCFAVSADLETELELYREEEMEVVTDLYDVKREVLYDRKMERVSCLKGSGFSETGIREIFNIPERYQSAEQVLFLSGTPVTGTVFSENGKGIAEGLITVKLLCVEEGTGIPFRLSQIIPFRCSVDISGAETGMETDAQIFLKNLWFDRINNRQIEVSGNLAAAVSVYEIQECPLVENLAFVQQPGVNRQPSVIVYIAGNEDTLWSVSKKYRMSLDGMKEVNAMTEHDTLRPGMKLLIVKENAPG